ncbi:MAG: hypothetical protein AB2L20_06565 [Mangrovibacterium sp.]
MKLIYTEQTLLSLEEALNFIALKVTHEKLIEIRDEILDAADILLFAAITRSKGTIFRTFRFRSSPFSCKPL